MLNVVRFTRHRKTHRNSNVKQGAKHMVETEQTTEDFPTPKRGRPPKSNFPKRIGISFSEQQYAWLYKTGDQFDETPAAIVRMLIDDYSETLKAKLRQRQKRSEQKF